MTTITSERPAAAPRVLPAAPAASVAPAALGIPSAAIRWVARGLVVAGICMIPWLFVLALQLPASPRAEHWPAAWVGLDAMEALGLLSTGILLRRRDPLAGFTATATATLLCADAWIDVMTAAPGGDLALAIAMAVVAEIPIATLLLVIAARSRDVTNDKDSK